MGRPCSWTYIRELLGDNWDEQVDDHLARNNPKRRSEKVGPHTDRAKELYKAFIAQPFVEGACTAHTIADPGFLEPETDDATSG
jgi:hypothetical protein